MFRRHVLSSLTVAVLAALGSVAGSAAGDVVYNSGGFEPPLFVPGDLTNQDPLNGPWQKAGVNGSMATVQVAKVQSGLQAVQVTREATAAGDARWGVLKPVANAILAAIDFDLNVQRSTLTSGFGPFVGVEAYDGLDNLPLLAGSVGIDATTGDVLYQATGTGALTETGTIVPFDTWNRFRLLLDYGNDRYSVFMNGNLLVTEPFVDPGIDDFTDAPIAVLAAAGDPISLSASGTGFVDNYVIQHVIPEPASIGVGLMSFVLGGATSRRRRS